MSDSNKWEGLPSVFHITHWKAGSQWISSVLKHAAPERFIQPKPGLKGPLGGPFERGRIYAPVYAPYSQFRQIVPDDATNRTFVVIRDPRDTLVSWYFSLMYSHPESSDHISRERHELRQMSKSDALALMACKHLQEVMWIQREWIQAGARIFRYEDFVSHQQKTFKEVFEFCHLQSGNLSRA